MIADVDEKERSLEVDLGLRIRPLRQVERPQGAVRCKIVRGELNLGTAEA